jgi:hypothetical protein
VVLLFQDAPEVRVHVLPSVGGHVVRRHAPELFLRVAERLLKRGVGLQDALGFGVDQADVLRGLLALSEGLLVLLALGGVTDCGQRTECPL